jgi:hypothetical protein
MEIVIFHEPKSEMFKAEFSRRKLEDIRVMCRLLLVLGVDGHLKETIESLGSSIDRVFGTAETLLMATTEPVLNEATVKASKEGKL